MTANSRFDMQEHRAVVVVGMHRSGTSLCMNVLQQLGFIIDTDTNGANAYNERGYFESRAFIRLNNQLLKCMGATWYSPPSFSEDWQTLPQLKPLTEHLISLLKKKPTLAREGWALKDPRISVLLPFYNQVFDECEVKPYYIICVRHPSAVSKSLANRDGFPSRLSHKLWLDYNLKIIEGTRNRDRMMIDYESWFENSIGQAKRIIDAVRPHIRHNDEDLKRLLALVIDPRLNHSHNTNNHFGEAELAIYSALKCGNLIKADTMIQHALQSSEYLHC